MRDLDRKRVRNDRITVTQFYSLSSYPPPPSSSLSHSADHNNNDMAKEKEQKPRIEIFLDAPYLFLKGVGVDVEPTLLSGHVAIHLNEATPIKEITLQFRGKARLPVPASESMTLNSAPLTYIVCTHDWSFLEGEKNSSHTLKAGRHLFPFQLRIGGSLPSTISSPAFGGAAVTYKLRAQIVRSGFFHQTYHTGIPVHIIRSFAPEAMEYQQTLEIENTWPEKLMYSIMIPHKAWAAGDKLTALMKFSPIAKGVCVLDIQTTIYEQTKVFARSGAQETTRIVASVKHEMVNGKAVEVENHRIRQPRNGSHPSSPGSPASPVHPTFNSFNRSQSSSSLYSLGRSHLPGFTSASSSSSTPVSEPASSSDVPLNVAEQSDASVPENRDVETYLNIHIPLTITPSHSLEPIIVSHRIRWSIFILNMDGHTSELRCSLPLHLLDYRLLNESRNYSSATRRLLMGEAEAPPTEEEDVQLPSYTQHLRDRVANMYLPENATMRVTNPWITQGANPVHPSDAPITSWPLTESGHVTPLEAHLLTNLPHQPDPNSTNGPLEWVNSELLISLSSNNPPRLRPDSPHHDQHRDSLASNSEPHSLSSSRAISRFPSRTQSRANSRANSPEPGSGRRQSSDSTYVHRHSNASRSTHSIFSATMKPLSSFSQNFLSRTPSSQHLPTAAEVEAAQRPTHGVRTLSVPDASTGTELLHRAFTEVPDYSIASRGFIGGVPPLTSMQGLPSYDESVRSSPVTSARNSVADDESGIGSETDLTRRFGELMTRGGQDAQEGPSAHRTSRARPPLTSTLTA
ncbi:hypothetical protein H0H93_002889 [Arthromyces matolae]|nr:hypothetical protein H0H93_002889 [Arthromyces matolae]